MRAAWVRGLMSLATMIGCLLVAGCAAVEGPPTEVVEGTGGGPCGPIGGALFRVMPPPHFVDWSFDGAHLTFDDVTSVRVVDAAGTRLRQIVDANPEYHFGLEHWLRADLSPDGQQVVYTSCEYPTESRFLERPEPQSPRNEYLFEIATASVDGSTTRRLTTDSEYDHMPSWSPDGRRIAFLSGGRILRGLE